MRKSLLLVASLILTLAWVKPAGADTIQFDYTGGTAAGTTINVDTFDWAPGNSLLIDNNDGTFTILYQANLGFFDVAPVGISAGDVFNGTGGFWYTAVAGFTVTVDAANSTATNTIFLLDTSAGTTNFFKIYADSAPANDLNPSLEGFTDGTEILSGTAVNTGFGSSFNITNTDPTGVLLDQASGDNWAGFTSITGNGSTQIQVFINSWDSDYFLSLVSGSSFIFSNTSQIAPYLQVNPSYCFSLTGTTDCTITTFGNPLMGSFNGAGELIMAQADANSSFAVGAPIPEPASLTLLGLGLLGSGMLHRRKMRKAAK